MIARRYSSYGGGVIEGRMVRFREAIKACSGRTPNAS
jgi:hypothetical protein